MISKSCQKAFLGTNIEMFPVCYYYNVAKVGFSSSGRENKMDKKVGHDSKERGWKDHLKAGETLHDIFLHLH
jgi:hypothetical protein